jgi:hypothetical protein
MRKITLLIPSAYTTRLLYNNYRTFPHTEQNLRTDRDFIDNAVRVSKIHVRIECNDRNYGHI